MPILEMTELFFFAAVLFEGSAIAFVVLSAVQWMAFTSSEGASCWVVWLNPSASCSQFAHEVERIVVIFGVGIALRLRLRLGGETHKFHCSSGSNVFWIALGSFGRSLKGFSFFFDFGVGDVDCSSVSSPPEERFACPSSVEEGWREDELVEWVEFDCLSSLLSRYKLTKACCLALDACGDGGWDSNEVDDGMWHCWCCRSCWCSSI